jgi:murein DD-endopeptidase MepM/ murein hydrolase activator NlpD
MFDSLMQQGLPQDKLEDFLGRQVRASAGSLQKMEYYRNQGGAHIYKSTFDRGLMDILISLDARDRINGLYLKPHMPVTAEEPATIERNSTPMRLPFTGEWFVFWGGENEVQNYHMANRNQQFAYDLLKVANGASYQGDPGKNENYLAYGQDIVAPCDATVVVAIDGVPDNVPGELNPIQVTGNTLVLKTPAGEYILMGHLKEGSIAVKKGQEVRQGDYLAQCGNSGNSSEAHLHLQLQNTRDFHKATGARLYFETLLVNGARQQDYMPVKEDFIQNSN